MIDRIDELIKILNQANVDYYENNMPTMTNKEYDKLYDELVKLEKESGIVLDNSPTQNVGSYVASTLSKKSHDFPMLSLNKTKSVEELKDFIDNKKAIISWKLDGLTIVVEYKNGILVEALTRGNGIVGEVVTNNVLTIRNIPKKIDFRGRLIVRGEAVINYSDFDDVNNSKLIEELKSAINRIIIAKESKTTSYNFHETMDANEFSHNITDIILNKTHELFTDSNQFNFSELGFKNPRNLCSGAIRQLDSSITKKRKVSFYAFSMVYAEDIDVENSHVKELEFLKKEGFDVVEYRLVDKDKIKESVEYFRNEIKNFDTPSDGLVVQFDDIFYGKSLGKTSKFPLDSIAFKWADESRTTKLIDVEWNTSRMGTINPVAIFEPVELEGTTVRRAAIHNLGIFESLQLGKGDEISVYKANMIIPQIDDNHTRTNTLHHPQNCPSCGRETQEQISVNAKELICPNELCPAKVTKFLENFISKNGMDINGLGKAKLNLFIEYGFITNMVDIFTLHKRRDEIVEVFELNKNTSLRSEENKKINLGDKSLDNIFNAIDEARNTDFIHVLASLNIKNVGHSAARLIMIHFENDIEKMINNMDQLDSIKGIGSVIATNIKEYFNQEKNLNLLYKLLDELNIKIEIFNKSSNINDKVFVITGKLINFKDRGELKNLLESKGAKVSTSVSSNTDYLINNDINSTSLKNKKAKELGVKIVTEQDVIDLINSYE